MTCMNYGRLSEAVVDVEALIEPLVAVMTWSLTSRINCVVAFAASCAVATECCRSGTPTDHKRKVASVRSVAPARDVIFNGDRPLTVQYLSLAPRHPKSLLF
jgi:hypothetical protein